MTTPSSFIGDQVEQVKTITPESLGDFIQKKSSVTEEVKEEAKGSFKKTDGIAIPESLALFIA
jgi:hypothetical protein